MAIEALNNDGKAFKDARILILDLAHKAKVDDLIVVQTPDTILMAKRHQADAIKKPADLLPPELR